MRLRTVNNGESKRRLVRSGIVFLQTRCGQRWTAGRRVRRQKSSEAEETGRIAFNIQWQREWSWRDSRTAQSSNGLLIFVSSFPVYYHIFLPFSFMCLCCSNLLQVLHSLDNSWLYQLMMASGASVWSTQHVAAVLYVGFYAGHCSDKWELHNVISCMYVKKQ